MYAFFHIAAFFDAAYDDETLCPKLSDEQVSRKYDVYAQMSDPESYPNYEAQARYDAQWGTQNGYSELDYQLAEREY